jgi:hypothetical protein
MAMILPILEASRGNGDCLSSAKWILEAAEGNPEHPIESRQNGAPTFSLERRELESQGSVFESHGLVTAHQESDESEHRRRVSIQPNLAPRTALRHSHRILSIANQRAHAVDLSEVRMVRPRGSDTSVFFRETDQPLTKASENFWDYAVALFFAKASAAGAWKVRTISSNIGESGGPGVTFRLRRSPPGKEVRRKDTKPHSLGSSRPRRRFCEL